jgi:type IV pilus assembly protein PilA
MRKFSDLREREGGFTLIELLVVIIIIGILAAIAIPLFLDQRKLAVDASVKSDVRSTVDNIVTAQATNAASFAGAVSGTNVVETVDLGATTPAWKGVVAGLPTAADTTAGKNVTPTGAFSVRGSATGGKVFVGGTTTAAPTAFFQFTQSTGQFGTVNTNAVPAA